MNINDMKIGDKLYRYVDLGGVFEYEVIGIRSYSSGNQLEVRCNSCSHGWKCEVLVAMNDYNKIVSIQMLNNDEDDNQRHWHCQEKFHFWKTPSEAKTEKLNDMINNLNQEIKKAEEVVTFKKKQLQEVKLAIEVAKGES